MGLDSNKHLDESLFFSWFSSQINLTHTREFMCRKCAGSMSALLTQLALFQLVSGYVHSLGPKAFLFIIDTVPVCSIRSSKNPKEQQKNMIGIVF